MGDPISTIILVFSLVNELLELISSASDKPWAKSSKTVRDELQLFRIQLEEHRQYVTDILKQADAVGFKLESLEKLKDELQKFCSSADSLFNKGCKKKDILELRERVMGTFQCQMMCAQMQMVMKNYEMQSKVYEELKDMTKKQDKQEMMSKRHDVHFTIFEHQARGHPKLMESLLFVCNMPNPTDILRERFSRVLGKELSNLLAPTEALEVDKAVMKELEKSGKECAGEDALEEDRVYCEKLEGAGKDVLEEEKNNKKRKETLLKDREKQGQRTTKLKEGPFLILLLLIIIIISCTFSCQYCFLLLILLLLLFLILSRTDDDKLSRKEMEKQGQRATELKDDEELDNPDDDKLLRKEMEKQGQRATKLKEGILLLLLIIIISCTFSCQYCFLLLILLLLLFLILSRTDDDKLSRKEMEKQGQRATELKELDNPDDDKLLRKEMEKQGQRAIKLKDDEELDNPDDDNLLRKEMEKQGQRATELKDDEELDNPNRDMELRIEEGKGDMLVSTIKDDEELDNPNRDMELRIEEGKGHMDMSRIEVGQFILTYKWYGKSMRMAIGKWPMKVSKKLGYFYFEVKLVEMAELAEGREMNSACVGVGLARIDKFRTTKVAGKYSKSCGYDGHAGEVFCESTVHSPRMGPLAKGETLGIGLLQHHGRHTIFFVKNGLRRLCIHDDEHTLRATSRHGGLYPVISLASSHVQLHVDFCGPAQLLELVAQVKATLAS